MAPPKCPFSNIYFLNLRVLLSQQTVRLGEVTGGLEEVTAKGEVQPPSITSFSGEAFSSPKNEGEELKSEGKKGTLFFHL